MIRIACIVEGYGEVEAVPLLVRRVLARIDAGTIVDIPRPYRVHRDKIVKAGEFEKVIEFGASVLGGAGGILVVLDSDDDCPAELGPALLARARVQRPDIPIEVVLAKMEFEAWFLAAAESIRGYRGLPSDLTAPEFPEAIRAAKGWLDRAFPTGGYSPTLDQAKLTARFDLDMAMSADSFEKCHRAIESLRGALVSSTEFDPGDETHG